MEYLKESEWAFKTLVKYFLHSLFKSIKLVILIEFVLSFIY